MTKISGYTALTTGVATDLLPVVDVSDTTMAATGTTKKITLANVQKANASNVDTNIQPGGAQASGAVGLNADAGHVHPAAGGGWIPSDNGLLAANYDPRLAGASQQITVAGNLYLLKIWIRQPFTATSLLVLCQATGSGASTQSFCGLWNSSGTLLTGSADIGSAFTSTGTKTLAFTTPQALTVAMGFIWAGFVFNMATTQPTLRVLSGGAGGAPVTFAVNLTAAQYPVAVNGTAVTSLASITPSANSNGGNATAYWCGIT